MPYMIGLIVFWFAIVVGWVMNVVQVINQFANLETFTEASGMLVIKTICIFVAPVGSVLGWVGLF